MANEYIGRLSKIGFGVEATAGTKVSADFWLKKLSGSLQNNTEKLEDNSALGVIDPVRERLSIKEWSTFNFEGIMTDDDLGWVLYLLFGTYESVQAIEITTPSGGTPARSDVVYVGAVSSETFIGEIKKIVTATKTFYFVSKTSGTLANGDTLTDGTWSGAVVLTAYAGVKGHFFSRANTNTHPTATVYDYNPVQNKYAAYGILSSIDVAIETGGWVTVSGEIMAKKVADDSGETPAYTNDNNFRFSDAQVLLATNEAGLNAATASCLRSFNVSMDKNLEEEQCLGSTDISAFYNTTFGPPSGNMVLTYNTANDVFNDYVEDNTTKAMRVEVIRDDLTALYTSGELFPSIFWDFGQISFDNTEKSDDNDSITSLTTNYTAVYDQDTAMTMECLLLSGQSSAYDGS